MNIIFAGTPHFAATHLATLLEKQFNVVAVYTQPDRPAGRGRSVQMSEVKQTALSANIPCYQPLSLKSEETVEQLRSHRADIMVVVAYGLILPESVLGSFTYGCINVHASLLPRWRGAAPIQRAIAAGDTETGITIMQMDAGLDTGDMLITRSTPISTETTGAHLHDTLADQGAKLLIEALTEMASGTLKAVPQDHSLATYADKLSKKEAEITWSKPAYDLHNLIRAFNSWPVAYTTIKNDRLRVWSSRIGKPETKNAPGEILSIDKSGIEIATGKGTLYLTELQLPGAKRLSCQALLNAHYAWLTPGFQLGQ